MVATKKGKVKKSEKKDKSQEKMKVFEKCQVKSGNLIKTCCNNNFYNHYKLISANIIVKLCSFKCV